MIENKYAPVAQLDRAADFESVGREFESPQARQLTPAPVRVRASNPTVAGEGGPHSSGPKGAGRSPDRTHRKGW